MTNNFFRDIFKIGIKVKFLLLEYIGKWYLQLIKGCKLSYIACVDSFFYFKVYWSINENIARTGLCTRTKDTFIIIFSITTGVSYLKMICNADSSQHNDWGQDVTIIELLCFAREIGITLVSNSAEYQLKECYKTLRVWKVNKGCLLHLGTWYLQGPVFALFLIINSL